MFDEWWGVTDHIKKTADQLAGAGFECSCQISIAAASAAIGDEANHLMEGLDFGDAATQDARGAAQYLREQRCEKGWRHRLLHGWRADVARRHVRSRIQRGGVVLRLSAARSRRPGKITIPVQGHWALHDGLFTLDGVDEIEARFKEAGVPHEFYRYDAQARISQS